MKGVISSLLLGATAVASATNCDVSLLTEIANSADASTCMSASNFVVPVESTVNTILTDLEAFCDSDACQRVLGDLSDLEDCSIDGSSLLQSVVNPIGAVCSTTRALRAADGSHDHSSGMDMGSASTEMEDSHEATSSSMEDSHDTVSASSGAEDSHGATSSTSASAEAGDEDSHDHTSSTATSSVGTASTTSSGSSTGSKATSSNSTSSTQAPSASSTSSATSISIAAGSVFLAAAAAFW